MAVNAHVPGGEGEQPIGAAKSQAKAIWANVNTQAAWIALTATDRWEVVRKFIKYAMMRWFGMA